MLISAQHGFRLPHQTALFYFVLAALCAALAAFAFAIQGSVGFSLWDEGFLWYGVQRVMTGEIPIRDFMAYDPARYYWSAALMWLYGDNGIMALRGTVAVFQTIGLFVGLTLLVRCSLKPNNIPLWLLAAITLMVWMFPRHKLFDISISIALVAALSFLVQQPTSRRYFLTGLFVGLVAVFGRNHGLYGVAGSLGVMTYLWLGREENAPATLNAIKLWCSGVVVGYIPMLFMFAVIPGFALAFWEDSRFLFNLKTTNLPLPPPWPWRLSFGQLPSVEIVNGMLIGVFFIAIVAFGLLGIAWVIRQRQQNKHVPAALVASVFLALPYAHHAYSRADVAHLAQSIFPFLLGSLALLANQPAKIKLPLAALLCGASLLAMLPFHPGWQCYSSQQCVEIDVAGNKLKVDPGTSSDLTMLHKLSEQFAPEGRSFIAAPYWPGAYAVLERKSPMWEIYALVPRNDAFQHTEIERIKTSNPGFVIILDYPLDGRNDLRFSNTHPHVERHIRDHFDHLYGYTQNSAYQLYKSKQVAQDRHTDAEIAQSNNPPNKQF